MAADVDGAWGPTVEGRRRRRVGRWTLLVVAVLLVALTLFALWLTSRIPKVEVDGLAGRGSPMHVLVVGSDSRAGLSEEEQRELSTGGDAIGGERTDTIFVMTVRGGDVALLAFPRDLWVTRCDGSEGRINVAQSLGGPGCLVSTVRELSGIDVHHYVAVSFGGFRDLVDAVGGVELCLDEPIADRDAGIDLPAGCQRLDGADALGYVRVRKIDNDLQRIRRQQRFLRALADEVARPSTLLNPVRLVSLSGEAGDALTVDRGMGPIDLARLGLGARGLASGELEAHTVPADPARTSGGADVLRIREAEAEELFSRFRDGSVLDGAEAAPRRQDVRVTVRNGARVDGLAARVGALLEERGYEVVGVGNADSRDATVVQHPPGQRAGAELLARDLPIEPRLEERSDVTTVTLVLGRDAAELA